MGVGAGGFSKKFSAIGSKGARGITVLFLSPQWLKLLHATGHMASRTVTTLLLKRIEGLSDREILGWLQETCRASNFEPAAVILANPSHLTTARLFTLPSTDPKEIRDIVDLQVEKHTPYAREDILTDFRVVEGSRAGYSRVLLVISHKDIVHRGLGIIEGMGWPLEKVGFELEGLVNWFMSVRGASAGQVVLLAEVDAESTTVVILQKGMPYFHRSIPLGANQLKENPEEITGQFVSEFQRSLEAFEAEGFNLSVGKVVLTGMIDGLAGVEVKMEQILELPTEVEHSFGKRFVPDAKMPEAERENTGQSSFSSLVGLAGGPSEVDLTPRALKLHRTFEIRARAMFSLGVKVIALLLLLTCMVIGKAYESHQYHAKLLGEYKVISAQAGDLEFSLEQLDLVNAWVRSQGRLLSVLAALSQATVPDLRWSSFTFRGDEKAVVVKGISREVPKVFDYVKALEASALFATVEARRVAQRRQGEEDVTEFEIYCTLSEVGV